MTERRASEPTSRPRRPNEGKAPRGRFFRFVLLVVAGALSWAGVLGGCSKVADVVVGGSDQAGGTGGGATSPGGGAGSGPVWPKPDCGIEGASCTGPNQCCSGSCDEDSASCVGPATACVAPGAGCSAAQDCCSFSCVSGACAESCVSDGAGCTADAECCSGSCQDGSCVALSLTCLTSGNACADSAECCSRLCSAGRCSQGSSFCSQKNDICSQGAACCSGNCVVAAGRELGVCGEPPPGPSNCSAGVAGTVCDACNECCSRLCAPFGDSETKICQPAGGCRLTGEVCRGDLDCCGGDPNSGLPGAGNVSCFKEAGAELGICRNAMSCSPQGNVCHYQDYTCSVSAAANKCCSGDGGDGRCQLDQLGVPRCTALGEDDCREAGQTCSSAIDCCEGAPCVADEDGVLRCQSAACGEAGASCSVTADCCAGTHCEQVVGTTTGICALRGSDPPAGACVEFGQICAPADECCGDVPCSEGRCQYPVR